MQLSSLLTGTLKPLYEELANDIGISHHGSDEVGDTENNTCRSNFYQDFTTHKIMPVE